MTELEREVAQAVKDLDTDPQAKVTVEEAIGEKAVAAFRESTLAGNPDLKAWTYNLLAVGVPEEGKTRRMRRVPLCVEAWNIVKERHEDFKKLHHGLEKALTKKLTREKALSLANNYSAAVLEYFRGETGFPNQVLKWRKYQEHQCKFVASIDNPDGDGVVEWEAWKKKSTAWKQVAHANDWWRHEVMVITKFSAALPK